MNDKVCDLSLRKYADDVNKSHVVSNALDAARKVDASDSPLDAQLGGAGMSQSSMKNQVVPHFVGRGGHRHTRALFYGKVPIAGQVKFVSPFLGSLTSANSANVAEIGGCSP